MTRRASSCSGVEQMTATEPESFLPLHRVGGFWSVTLRTPAQPAILSYVFRVRVAGRVLWYGDDFGGADDDLRQGGTGIQSRIEAQGFQLTVYDARFTTPSWLQSAVVYSIFPDRFRNGTPANDYCRPGGVSGCPTFYGSVPAQLPQTWNEPIEDPHSTGVFNRDFFGGDLEGIQEKLGYLKSLGVDAIWLMPVIHALPVIALLTVAVAPLVRAPRLVPILLVAGSAFFTVSSVPHSLAWTAKREGAFAARANSR